MANQITNHAPETTKPKPKPKLCSGVQKIIFGINIFIMIFAVLSYFVTDFVLKIFVAEHNSAVLPPKQDALSVALRCLDKAPRTATFHYASYWVLQNYVMGTKSKNAKCAEYVTFITHARDVNDLKYLSSLVFNWQSPVSIALFAPGGDFNRTLRAIQYARNCLKSANLITEYVSFNILIPHDHMPVKVPHGKESPLSWPYDCNDKSIGDQASASQTYAYKQSLPYPVNLMRNIARNAANTYYHLNADIKYTPNLGAGKKFIDMIYAKLCLHKNGRKGSLRSVEESCIGPHSTQDIMKLFRMLPEGIDYLESIYPLPAYVIRDESINPQNLDDVQALARKGAAKIEEYNDLYYIGDNSAPRYDERFHWQQSGAHNLPLFYAICLGEFKSIKVQDQFLYHLNLPTTTYPPTAPYTDAASYLNETILQSEYLNLYSRVHEEECKMCFAKRENCIR